MRLPQPAQPPRNLDKTQPPQPQKPPILPLNTEVTIPLKYFSNFWRSFDFSLINYEIGLDLSWTKDCLVIEQNSTKQA